VGPMDVPAPGKLELFMMIPISAPQNCCQAVLGLLFDSRFVVMRVLATRGRARQPHVD
jgi:hypothetical protein